MLTNYIDKDLQVICLLVLKFVLRMTIAIWYIGYHDRL